MVENIMEFINSKRNLTLPKAPTGLDEDERDYFYEQLNSNIDHILERAESWSKNTNRAIGQKQGLFMISSISYYPCETENERMLVRMFGQSYSANQRYKDITDVKKLLQKSQAPFIPSQPTNGLSELVKGEFMLIEAGQYRYGLLKIGEMKHSNPSLVEYNRDNIVPILSMYPNPHMVQYRTANMNEDDARITFYTKDVLGSQWSIHCNFPKGPNKK